VAPKEVKSSDIYWGALPWVGLQMLMVLLVAALPQTVTAFLDRGTGGKVESGDLHIEQPAMPDSLPAQKQDDEQQPELNFSQPEEEKKK
jgi:hypothetical protein